MSIENCPVVYPTWAQFNDFLGYTEYLEKTYSSKYGMVKVSLKSLRSCPQLDGRPVQKAIRTLILSICLVLLNRMLMAEEESTNVCTFRASL